MADFNSTGTASDVRSPERRHVRALGTILIEAGLLRSSDLDEIHRFAIERGLKFGAAAVQLNLLRPEDVDLALARQFDYPSLPLSGPGSVDFQVIAAHSPEDPSVESIRALRSQLTYRWLKTAQRKALAIVSAERRDGRSWLAANLATAFAHMGKRTLLIDADMRNPRQHELFKLNNGIGLSSLLSGRAGADVAQLVHPQLRLYVLPAGATPPNPQELLARDAFDVVLELCAEKFDLVIIDTPAATETSDAQIVACHARSAVLLARQDHTHNKKLQSAMQCLTDTGVHIVGSVIND